VVGKIIVFGRQQGADEIGRNKRIGVRRISPNSAISFSSLL